jgi:hypothetical protein
LFLFEDSNDLVEQYTVRMKARANTRVRLSEQRVDLSLLRFGRLLCPMQRAVVAKAGLADDLCRQPRRHSEVAGPRRPAGARPDVVGAEDDFFCSAPGQHGLELFEHRPPRLNVTVGGERGDEDERPVHSRDERDECEVVASCRAHEPGNRVSRFVHGDAPHLVRAEARRTVWATGATRDLGGEILLLDLPVRPSRASRGTRTKNSTSAPVRPKLSSASGRSFTPRATSLPTRYGSR